METVSHGFLWILPRSPRNPSWFLSLSPSSDHTEVILSPNVCSWRVNTVPSGITSWHQFPPVLINYCLKMTLCATKHEIFYDWKQILGGILQKYEWEKDILDVVLSSISTKCCIIKDLLLPWVYASLGYAQMDEVLGLLFQSWHYAILLNHACTKQQFKYHFGYILGGIQIHIFAVRKQ